jgi:DNA polymerase III delta prime subunit
LEALEKLAELAQGDLRHCLNVMQTWRLTSASLSYGEVTKAMDVFGKEASTVQNSIFDLCGDYFFSTKSHNVNRLVNHHLM